MKKDHKQKRMMGKSCGEGICQTATALGPVRWSEEGTAAHAKSQKFSALSKGLVFILFHQ